MSQEIKIVARTFETETVSKLSGYSSDELDASANHELTVLAGKAAGVCYMPDNYFEDGVQNVEKALNRAMQTSASGHHSVYDHGHLTLVVKTNKMMAMILNSLGVYATSEKSARYTKMKPDTDLELQLYNKWKEKIQQLILNKYPNTDDVELRKRFYKWFKDYAGENQAPPSIKNNTFTYCMDDKCWDKLEELKKSETLPSMKLAMENARYMISVFTPTTMMYTISFRQAFLTIEYLYKLSVNLDNASDSFSEKLKPYVIELWKTFENALGEIRLFDNKNQHIRFLEAQHVGELYKDNEGINRFKCFDNLDERLVEKQESLGDSYTTVYEGSLAMLAQAQRHRTLRYSMCLREAGEYGWYVPEIVSDAGLSDEWLEDISSVGYCIPQGTMVRITEQGLFEDFALKCKERLCGRAQLEVMHSTETVLMRFVKAKDKLSYTNAELLNSMIDNKSEYIKPCARCGFTDFTCSEGCQWGPKEALNRLI